MLKKTFSIIFICFFAFLYVFTPITASAYEVTGLDITAKAGMLVSLDTDEILYENNIDKKVYPASITKIMTAVLMLESDKWDPKAKVKINKACLDVVLGTGLSVSLLSEGEEFTQLDLLYTVLVSSYGDCTYLAAELFGGSYDNFVKMMNDKAAELGLSGTHYSNPVGLHEEETYTTARDTYTLTKYALQYELFKTVTSTSRYRFTTTKGTQRTLSTTNFLLDKNTNYWYQYAGGVKTGYTDIAGRCLVSTASYNGYNYMCILFGCTNSPSKRYDFVETKELYRWAFNNFSYKEVADSDEPVCEIPVELSTETDFVPLYFKKPFVTILPNGADDSTLVMKNTFVSETVDAPIKKGDVLGYSEIYYAEKIIGKVDLVAGNDVEKSFWLSVVRHIENFFTSSYMKIIYIVIALVVVGFLLLCIYLNRGKKKRKVKYIPYEPAEKRNDKNK
ncbi:MAG: serine hydrolase [Clostridia bacterium]|nr:serine hydrolase [Clostridia bacterium]